MHLSPVGLLKPVWWGVIIGFFLVSVFTFDQPITWGVLFILLAITREINELPPEPDCYYTMYDYLYEMGMNS